MNVFYKCGCMDKEREVSVPDRVADSDVVFWMEIVQACLGYDHTAFSPDCNSVKMEYVKIPVPEGSVNIGEPVKKH